MATGTYSISLTTEWTKGAGGNYAPDPTKVFGALVSGGKIVDWPSTLTRISESAFPDMKSITTTVVTVFAQDRPIRSHAYGQYYLNGEPAPWPLVATGTITVPAKTNLSPSASTAQSKLRQRLLVW